MKEDQRTRRVIGAAIAVHRELGPGLLESAYEACLVYELRARGAMVVQQVEVPVRYRGITLGCGFRLDLLVDDAVIVEVKAVERVLPIHRAQLISYLKLARKSVGLLINFHVARLASGIDRYALGDEEPEN